LRRSSVRVVAVLLGDCVETPLKVLKASRQVADHGGDLAALSRTHGTRMSMVLR
jgi:hypothetical protein